MAYLSAPMLHSGSFLSRLWRAVLVLGLMLFAASAATAAGRPTNITAELIAEGPVAPGQTVTLALRMTPGPGWHGYWLNPGDAGFGMTLAWDLPAGAKAGAPRYPVPGTLLIAGLMNHVYKGEYAVLVPLTLPAYGRPGESLPVGVDAEWLACTDQICVPERARLATTVVLAAPGSTVSQDGRFESWRAKLPAPLGAQARFSARGAQLRIAIPIPRDLPMAVPHVFPVTEKLVAYAAPQEFRRLDDVLIVTMARNSPAAPLPQEILGLLRIDDAGNGVEFVASPGPVPTGGTRVAADTAPGFAEFALLVLAALAGGLLLNVMPCVFPILSLKALSLARAGESTSHARREGLAYTAGVIVACAALGGVMLALRAAGHEIGWAFQLQEPAVVVGLLLLATAITANFAGVYEFAVPRLASESGPAPGTARNAFATGLLAAFVATPCTGPFMATAMGAALLLPPAQAMTLFIALGLGLALPFLAIAWIPALRRALPRPGRWMVTFRNMLAVPMALTAAALAWLTWRLGGQVLLGGAVALAVLLIVVLAVAGKRQGAGRGAAGTFGAGLALVAAGAATLIVLAPITPPAAGANALDAPFSAGRLDVARREGRPVFAYFTADWCLTCKVNEQVAIDRAATRAAFERGGVVVLRGDWTRRDPAITRFLSEHGAAGVPLYVWYPADGAEPEVLPQVLTSDMLRALVHGSR